MARFDKPIVFINYRRADARSAARNLNDNLEAAFGQGFVFQDVDDLVAGEVWSQKLIEAGSNAKVILAVIGSDWLQIKENGQSRLFDEGDWVRKELELAIEARKIIIPVLVNGGTLPDLDNIPDSLHPVFDHQIFELRDDKWGIDRDALIKDITKVTGIKTKQELSDEDSKKKSKQKMLWLTSALVGIVALFLGYIFWPSDPPVDKPQVDLGRTDTTYTLNGSSDRVLPFCPDFDSDAEIKTLLYPFDIQGQNIPISDILKRQISNICRSNDIEGEIKSPNSDQNVYYDPQDAKRNCDTCTSDIFITGICYSDGQASYNLNADIGFCNPLFEGYDLDNDKLSIMVSNSNISDLVSDPDIAQSFEYSLEVILGIYQIKSGNIEEGVKIIKRAINKYPPSKEIENVARDILWQAQYKLGRTRPAIGTLDKWQALNPNNNKILLLKSELNYKVKEYDKAILDLNTVISKNQSSNKRNKYIEKRGDVYFDSKQYNKARQDYKTTNSAKEAKAKHKMQINNNQISQLQATTNLTAADKATLVNLYTQNGQKAKAVEVLNSIDPAKLNSPQKMNAVGLDASMLKLLEKEPERINN